MVAGAWHAVALASSLPAGSLRAVHLAGEDLLLWRGPDGLHAWQDLCVHRGAKLSLGAVVDGQVRCAYHGWTYDGDGRCTRIPAHPGLKPPAKARARTYLATEAGGLIWVNLTADPAPHPWLPEMDDVTFRLVPCGPFEVAAGAPRLVENFLDVSHLPFVHAGSLGDPEQAGISHYEVEESPAGLLAKGLRVRQPDPDGRGRPAEVSYDYGVLGPFTAFLRKAQPDGSLVILFHATPQGEGSSTGWFVLMMNYGDAADDAAAADFQARIFAQDRAVVESQRPEQLPLDLAAEIHLPSDRLAVAYRRYLRRCGLSFGTA